MTEDKAKRLAGFIPAVISGLVGFAVLYMIDPLIMLGVLLVAFSARLGKAARKAKYD